MIKKKSLLKRLLKRSLQYGFIAMLATVALTFLCNFLVERNARGRLFQDTKNIPYNKVGLLLGTSKYLAKGRINLYYKFRVEAAVRLFKAGKVDYILVSGDNRFKNYNEPETFKSDLIEAGIPADRIILDYAGFRTLDSIVRAGAVFGQKSFTVISQPFHNERALYLAKSFDMDAIGFNAKDVRGSSATKIKIREYLARVKLMLDLVFGKEPKFLGEPIAIP